MRVALGKLSRPCRSEGQMLANPQLRLIKSAPKAVPLRAGIYARKSTDDSDKSEDLRSCSMQVENARAYAEQQGWRIADEHIYADDGVSGALVSRPAFDQLKLALGIEEGVPLRRAPDLTSLP